LKTGAAISTFLPSPVLRLDVPVAGAPFKGPETAAVTIVKFEDFDCSFCRSAQTTLDQLLARYGDRVKLVHRDFPIDPGHAKSLAHEAARCAGDQGRFWAYHDALYASTRKSTSDELKVHAKAIGLDVDAFARCLEDGTRRELVQRDVEEGRRVGVKATPTFFVNGRPLAGAQPLERFVEIVDQELMSLR
jgi:protein-disulfide isomerase